MLKMGFLYSFYNGDIGDGDVIEKEYSFEINDDECISNSTEVFYKSTELDVHNKSSVDVSISFKLSEDEIAEINDIIHKIQSNKDYLYSESHYVKDYFDLRRYWYVSVSINGDCFELLENDENLKRLKILFKFNQIDKSLSKAMNDLFS